MAIKTYTTSTNSKLIAIDWAKVEAVREATYPPSGGGEWVDVFIPGMASNYATIALSFTTAVAELEASRT